MNTDIHALLIAIAKVGKESPSSPALHLVEPFEHFFDGTGNLKHGELNRQDGSLTRREVLTRFLLLNAVLDQGPDIVGLRQMLIQVTTELYKQEIRFLHKPISFFQEIGLSIDEILAQHKTVKSIRSAIWAEENLSQANRYNLFMDNSRQVLGYAIFRWGVPLALPYLLEKDAKKQQDEISSTLLLDYLESHSSTEQMTKKIKEDRRYGLGEAIGDKSVHLFGKWLVSCFNLTRQNSPGWGEFSYEVPYDSNAGRVLWRTGYLLNWANEETYKQWEVLQPGKGKSGTTYIRVTNLQGKKAESDITGDLRTAYNDICIPTFTSSRASKH